MQPGAFGGKWGRKGKEDANTNKLFATYVLQMSQETVCARAYVQIFGTKLMPGLETCY